MEIQRTFIYSGTRHITFIVTVERPFLLYPTEAFSDCSRISSPPAGVTVERFLKLPTPWQVLLYKQKILKCFVFPVGFFFVVSYQLLSSIPFSNILVPSLSFVIFFISPKRYFCMIYFTMQVHILLAVQIMTWN